MEGLLAKGRGDMKVLMVKAGVALALSFAGYVFLQLRPPRAAAARLLPPPSDEMESKKDFTGLKKKHLLTKKLEKAPTKFSVSENGIAVAGLSPLPQSPWYRREFEHSTTQEAADASASNAPTTSGLAEAKDNFELKLQIAELKNVVKSLEERAINLEGELLEYYGLKEQDFTVKELTSRLKVSAVEAKLLNLKVESLQAENRRLEVQLYNYSKVAAELELAKERIEELKVKLRFNYEQAEEIVALQERIACLEGKERSNQEHFEETEANSKKFKELEDEALNLRRENSEMAQINSDLTKRLNSIALTNTTKVAEVKILEEKNMELSKEIEQLQTDRCADVEELVYLRWVNACLRYELRNHQPVSGKTVAKDLNNTLSPKSEHQAKQLIVKYANSVADESRTTYYDSDCWSSSQDSEENVSTISKSSNGSTKHKFFSKLKKLVGAKELHHKKFSTPERTPNGFNRTRRRASVSNIPTNDSVERNSYDSISIGPSLSMDRGAYQHSKFGWDESESRCKSDVGSSNGRHTSIFEDRSSSGSSVIDRLIENESMELKKFAEVLKNTHNRSVLYL